MPFKNGFYLLSSFNKLVGAHDGGRTVIVHPFGTPYQAQKVSNDFLMLLNAYSDYMIHIVAPRTY